MSEYTVAALDERTWPAYAALLERHNGVFGGCWCTWFHTMPAEKTRVAEDNRALREERVRAGTSRAAVVFDGDEAVAWAQFGTPAELPNIYHRKEVAGSGDPLPDWRITCMFVGKGHRRRGLLRVAARGAIDLIAASGGGVVEVYPHETEPGKRQSVLYSGTRKLFEDLGFTYVRPKGPKNCIMRLLVAPHD
jgi:hypothetical protein